MTNGLLHSRRRHMVLDALRFDSVTGVSKNLGISRDTVYTYIKERQTPTTEDLIKYHKERLVEQNKWLETEAKALAALASYYEREQRKWEAGKRR